jgi:hypothetical protein
VPPALEANHPWLMVQAITTNIADCGKSIAERLSSAALKSEIE